MQGTHIYLSSDMHLLASHFVLQVVIDGPHKGKEEKKEMSVFTCYCICGVLCIVDVVTCTDCL